ncbi:hypothetical protein EYF80_028760 [Liparis tanakae]|uniref:Uncharacterized protein n=1 Tax=Liparis tanakae TaxID=230148 RepID=A0A4Z2H8A0_9TELE|nr:hypothetical protein EYF80_028760 [Liparis tanakae]
MDKRQSFLGVNASPSSGLDHVELDHAELDHAELDHAELESEGGRGRGAAEHTLHSRLGIRDVSFTGESSRGHDPE